MMPPIQEYDLFLSYATEDRPWAEMLAERLRSEGVRVWFDQWELQPGDHVKKLNDGLKHSRKVVAVWTPAYFRDDKVWTLAESYAKQSPDVLARERPLIPLLRQNCDIEPLFRPLIYLDCRNDDDFELRFRQLIESLDLPSRELLQREREELELGLREHELTKVERGLHSYKKGKRFEDEVAALYRLLGFETKLDIQLSGFQIDLLIEQEVGGIPVAAIVECKDKRLTAEDRDQILAQQFKRSQKLPAHRCLAVSSQGFTADTRTGLEESGVHCTTYRELLRKLVPLDNYADGLIAEYEKEAERKWNNEDWFIRPDLMTDITYERMPALQHLSKWLGEARRNQLVILGDLGAGKTTLASFLAYNLARSFRDDPLRHPAPVLIPLKEVRKEFSLEGIVINHFTRRGLRDISFTRFEHLVRLGKIILLFDAFDEMADRIRWEDTQSNFRELSRAADLQGKVILTCRTHYFKDRTEQVKVIGEGPKLSETETDLYRELRQRSTAEVVFLQEFDDEKIQHYLRKARPRDYAADWLKIQEMWNLKDLATRPLLLDMIVKSLPRLKEGQEVNAASLYNVYTAAWIDREEDKGRKFRLDKNTKLALMMELAWRMWCDEKQAVHYRELGPFVEKLVADQKIEIGDEEIADIASEMQGASFLKRDEKGNFSFMHRSFGEFFVARKINDSLANPDALREVLNTRRYDQKTIFFLSQLDENDAMREPLQQILLNGSQENISENALQLLYWSARIRAGMEDEVLNVDELKAKLAGRIPAKANLIKARLQEVVLECADLTGINFFEADLTKAKLNHSTIDNASFNRANLTDASLENVLARDAEFLGTTLSRVSFNQSNLTGSDFRDAEEISAESFLNATTDKARGLTFEPSVDTEQLFAVVQLGAANQIQAVAYSPKGELLASGGGDGVIRLYRASDGVLLRAIEGHKGLITSLSFSPDGSLLASGSSDHSVKLWQVNSGKALRSLDGHSNAVNAVSFSPDGSLLASGSSDKSVKLWQVNSGKALRSLDGHSRQVSAVSFSPDGSLLASGSYDNSVKLWQVNSGKEFTTLFGNLGAVLGVAFSRNGKFLVAAGRGGRLQFWDHKTGQTFLYRYSFGPGAWMDLLPDGRFDCSPEALRYLGYTENGTLRHYPAESLVKEFHSPEAVQAVLAKYIN